MEGGGEGGVERRWLCEWREKGFVEGMGVFEEEKVKVDRGNKVRRGSGSKFGSEEGLGWDWRRWWKVVTVRIYDTYILYLCISPILIT